MIYGSVCSGIEAASVAWGQLGWKSSFLSEIEAFPRAVLAHHYPGTPLHGDFTTIQKGDYAAIDLLVGGTPCQSFSVAGLRAGLDDPRGNLMLEFGALARRLAPRWLVWENVPGVLSSNEGRDFGTFLGMLAELGYGFAYRVLDAQYFRVAQRRRRVFVVGYFGDWRRAAAVLFERDSLLGNPAPRRQAGKVVAGSIMASTAKRGGIQEQDGGSGLIPAPHADISPAIKARDSKGVSSDGDGDGDGAILVPMVSHALRGEGFDASEDGTGRGTPLVPVISGTIQNSGKAAGSDAQQDAESGLLVPIAYCETMPTMRAAASQDGPGHGARSGDSKDEYVVPVAYRTAGDGAVFEEGDVTAPLTTGTDACANVIGFAQNQRDEVRTMNVAGALTAEPGAKQQTYVAAPAYTTKLHMNKVASIGCILCRHLGFEPTPAQLHHIREGQGMSQRAADTLVIPLCQEHHQGNTGLHGLGVKAFERTYRVSELDLLAETLEALA